MIIADPAMQVHKICFWGLKYSLFKVMRQESRGMKIVHLASDITTGSETGSKYFPPTITISQALQFSPNSLYDGIWAFLG